MIGMPSLSMVKAMAFLSKLMSCVTLANRGWSWFSRKDPRRLVSFDTDLSVLTPLARLPISPEVDLNAAVIQ